MGSPKNLYLPEAGDFSNLYVTLVFLLVHSANKYLF